MRVDQFANPKFKNCRAAFSKHQGSITKFQIRIEEIQKIHGDNFGFDNEQNRFLLNQTLGWYNRNHGDQSLKPPFWITGNFKKVYFYNDSIPHYEGTKFRIIHDQKPVCPKTKIRLSTGYGVLL